MQGLPFFCPTSTQQQYPRNIQVSFLADGISFDCNTSLHSSQRRPTLVSWITFPWHFPLLCTFIWHHRQLSYNISHTQTICMGNRWLGQADILVTDIPMGEGTLPIQLGTVLTFWCHFSAIPFQLSQPVWDGYKVGFFQLSNKCTFSPLVPGGLRCCLKAYMEDDKRITVQSKKGALPTQWATKDQFGWPPPHLILPMATVPRDATPPRNGPCKRPSAYRLAEFFGLQDFLYWPMCLCPWDS